jgi:hypothetical protein
MNLVKSGSHTCTLAMLRLELEEIARGSWQYDRKMKEQEQSEMGVNEPPCPRR